MCRCVSQTLLTKGMFSEIWMDRGSGANANVGIWECGTSNTYVNGLATGVFFAQGNYDLPSGTPNMPDLTKSIESSALPPNMNAAIKLRPAEMSLVWKDSGSGANRDFSSYHPKDCPSLADSGVGNYVDKPVGYCVEALKPQSLVVPSGWSVIWKDSGSGADWDGSFWKFSCPAGFVALGHAAKRDYNQPDINNYRCVNSSLVTSGTFSNVWEDKGSGANEDCSIYQANPNSDGLGVSALYAVNGYHAPYETALILKSYYVRVESGRPITKVDVLTISYQMDRKALLFTTPFAAQSTTVSNCGAGAIEQSVSRDLSYTETVTSSWNWGIEIAIGVAVTWKAEDPITGSGSSTALSVTVTTSYGQTFETSRAVSDTMTVNIVIPGGKTTSAWVVGRKDTMDVPFTATVRYTYTDGTTSEGSISGEYKGMTIVDVEATYGDMLSC